MKAFLHSAIDYIHNYSEYILGISVLVLSLSEVYKNWTISAPIIKGYNLHLGWIIYGIFIVLSFIFTIWSISRSRDIIKLETKVSSLENEISEKSSEIRDLESRVHEVVSDSNELFNSYLRLLNDNLNFTHTERISVYKVYDNTFKLIGRISKNPILEEKGRAEYPIDEGFIGKGWSEGEFFVDDLPDPNSTGRKKNSYYDRTKAISPLAREIVDNLKMKSRSYFVIRLDGHDMKPKAVLVFESKNEKSLNKEFIVSKLHGVNAQLVMFVEKNNGVVKIENTLGI